MRTAVGVRRDFAKSFGVGCSPSDSVGEPDVTGNQISCAGALPQREVIPHQFTATLSALEMRYMLVSIPADPGFDEKLSRAVLRVSTPDRLGNFVWEGGHHGHINQKCLRKEIVETLTSLLSAKNATHFIFTG